MSAAAPATAAATAVEACGIEKSFRGIRALRGVSLRVAKGEARALVGANGAGKSTLINVICGAVQPDAGSLQVDGRTVAIRSPRTAIELGIATVHQHDQLVPNLTVAQNVELGDERSARGVGWLTRGARRARAALELVGLEGRADQTVEGMSLAHRQLVSIARAVSRDPHLLILDEPTAALTPLEAGYLMEVIGRLRERGTSLLYVTHRLQELAEIVDWITVMRDGEVVAERSPAVAEADLVELIAGEGVAVHDQQLAAERRRLAGVTGGTKLLRTAGLVDAHGAFRDIDLEVRTGEVLGVAGLPDSGASELLEAIAGARKVAAGTISLDGRALRSRSPRAAARDGIGYLAGDRARRGVVPNSDVAETVALSALPRHSRGGFLRRRQIAVSTRRRMEECKVDPAVARAPITTLSGGNQQKALFARVLANDPRVVVCEDPTAGIDVAGRESIYDLVARLCESGGAVIWAASDLRELVTICDRVVVLWRGTVVAELTREGLDESSLVRAQFNQGGEQK
ncbi:MAG: sugar ABC transporter ATP-binding protein [Actinobacteria bacterium]|nr:sugar ABC transporter ATP-binding protein [Actinomycetota bacterium]